MVMDHVHGQEELNSMMRSTTESSVDVYNDDEAPADPPPDHALRSGVLLLNMHCEYPAVPNGAEHKDFAVLVHLKAPPLQVPAAAAPVDLVAVLDVSDSNKLSHVKRAIAFVVDRLGPRDRLSVAAFSGGGGAARRLIRLTRMTDDGKAAAKLAVETLEASAAATGGGLASVRAGLDEAARVLAGSRHRNDVVSVILVSGGGRYGGESSDDDVLVPPFYQPPLGSRVTPVHTFLLGSGDDDTAAAATALHGISEVTGGTFSFVEEDDAAAIQDALARCIAGLLSVTVREAFVKIKCAMFPLTEDMLRVTAIKSGRYQNSVKFESPRYRPTDEVWVILGQLYAGEERHILCFLDVPAEDADEDPRDSTRLVNVRCSYVDVVSGQTVDVEPADFGRYEYIKILRPLDDLEAAADMAARRRCVKVERELLRVAAAEDMVRAHDAAERGDYAEAARILDVCRESISLSAPAMSGDTVCAAMADELHELSRRVADESEYRKTGRACILASMSSHSLQRGSSTSLRFGSDIVGSSPSMFATPTMRKMEKLSETLRKKQQEVSHLRTTLPENGTKANIPLVDSHRRLEARLASAVPRLNMLSRYRRLVLRR